MELKDGKKERGEATSRFFQQFNFNVCFYVSLTNNRVKHCLTVVFFIYRSQDAS